MNQCDHGLRSNLEFIGWFTAFSEWKPIYQCIKCNKRSITRYNMELLWESSSPANIIRFDTLHDLYF